MRPVVVAVGPLVTAAANNICTSQTPTSGTALTLNGSLVVSGVAVLDTPRRVLLTHGNEASARTLVVVGTNVSGNSISETLAIPSGGAATVATVLDYKTVTSLTPAGGGWTAAVTVGTNGVAGSAWIRLDDYSPAPVTLMCDVTGTVDYTVQQTMNDPNSISDPVDPALVTWIASSDTAVVGATADKMSSFAYPPAFTRVLLNSGTGSVTMTVTQMSSPTR